MIELSEHTAPGLQSELFGRPRYRVLYADPPWQFETRSEKGRDRSPDAPLDFGVTAAPLLGEAEREASGEVRHYPTMPTDAIAALPVEEFAARDCVLFMWCVQAQLPDALRVGAAWGFTYKTIAFVWVKTVMLESLVRVALEIAAKLAAGAPFLAEWLLRFTPIGPGYWTRGNPEICLMFTRGEPKRKPNGRGVRQLIFAPLREHSRKPDEIRTNIEALVDGPYLELFARTKPKDWDVWGNQTERFSAEQPAELVTT